MTDEQDLLQKYVDERDAVSEDELAAVVDLLKDNPDLVEQLKEQLVVNDLLGQHLAVDRAHFDAQVEQRIRDHALGEQELDRQASELNELAREQLGDQVDRNLRRKWRRRFWASITLLLMGCVSFAFGYRYTPFFRPLAEASQVAGTASLVSGDSEQPLVKSQPIFHGNTVITGADGLVALRFRDGSQLNLRGNTSVTMEGRYPWSQRCVVLTEGSVLVDSRAPDSPLLLASPQVVGTLAPSKSVWAATSDSTRIEILTGQVSLSHAGRQEQVVATAAQAFAATASGLDAVEFAWPVVRDGLVLHSAARKQAVALVAPGGRRADYPLAPQGPASYGDNGQLFLNGGSFVAAEISDYLLAKCQKTDEFTVEATLVPDSLFQLGAPRLIAFAESAEHYNFVLAQRATTLIMQVDNGKPASVPAESQIRLCQLDGEFHHVAITARDGQLNCYLDGKLVQRVAMETNFSQWQKYPLLFGSDADGSRAWNGVLEGIAIYKRALGPDEVEQNCTAYQQLQRLTP